jgi:hypothetical protein
VPLDSFSNDSAIICRQYLGVLLDGVRRRRTAISGISTLAQFTRWNRSLRLSGYCASAHASNASFPVTLNVTQMLVTDTVYCLMGRRRRNNINNGREKSFTVPPEV